MELCLIAPIDFLHLTPLLPGRFCLAHIAAQNEEYLDYFLSAREKGYKVILDSGVFEGEEVETSSYIDLVRTLQPAVVIAPDVIGGDTDANYAAGVNFAHTIKEVTPDVEVMFVPQVPFGDESGFWSILEKTLGSNTFQWIGICRDAVYNAFGKFTHTAGQEENRFYFTNLLKENRLLDKAQRAGKKWHFLGVGDSVHLIQHYWFVDSMDTASFFWQAANGVQLVGGQLETEVSRPRDYFIRDYGSTMSEEDVSLMEEMVRENCYAAAIFAQKATKLRATLTTGRV